MGPAAERKLAAKMLLGRRPVLGPRTERLPLPVAYDKRPPRLTGTGSARVSQRPEGVSRPSGVPNGRLIAGALLAGLLLTALATTGDSAGGGSAVELDVDRAFDGSIGPATYDESVADRGLDQVVVFGRQHEQEEEELGAGKMSRSPMAALLVAAGEKPQLIQLAAAPAGYNENSSVHLLCAISQGHHESLTFDWFKDGDLLAWAGSAPRSAPQIEKHPDHSLLRIESVKSQHAGRYTCTAKNQFGLDSSSVLLTVNVKLQWIIEPPGELVVSVNQELKLDCLAQGEPKPTMRWEKVEPASMSAASLGLSNARLRPSQTEAVSSTGKNQLVSRESQSYKLHHHHQLQHPVGGASQAPPLDLTASSGSLFSEPTQTGSARRNNHVPLSSGRLLSIPRAKESDAGIYECIASNSHDAQLKKLVHVQVRGK